MSGDIKQWALTVCIAAVSAAVLEMLIPDSKYEKLLKPLIAAVAILAVISPLKGIVYGCDRYIAESGRQEISTGLRDTVNAQTADIVASVYKSAIDQAIGGVINGKFSTEVIVSVEDDGRIYVTQVRINTEESFRLCEGLIKDEAARAAGLELSEIVINYE